MKFNDMTEHEKIITTAAITILSEPMQHNIARELDTYLKYTEKLWALDEGDIALLEYVIRSNNRNPDYRYSAVTEFLDHPEERFKYVRYVR